MVRARRISPAAKCVVLAALCGCVGCLDGRSSLIARGGKPKG